MLAGTAWTTCLPCPAHSHPPGSLPRWPDPQVVKYLCEMINKKDKKANVKPFMAKNHLWVFVNCLIENPAFDSQVRLCRCCHCHSCLPWHQHALRSCNRFQPS